MFNFYVWKQESGQRYKHLTRFSWFVLSEDAASICKRSTLSTASIFVTEDLFIYIYFLLFEEIIKIGFPELEKIFLQRFRSFFEKWLLKY